jgi:Flp pilus assembly protein TadD
LTASVASFLTQAQKKGAELPPALSGALLIAAVRLSDAQRQAVRPYQLLVDDDGALELLTGDAPATDGYAAPELRNGAVLSDDPRVLVFAAGALGYEMTTLTPPRPGDEGAGPEVRGPLAPVIRKAMAERQHRYKTLRDMARAIEAIQGRPSRDEERLILAAIAASTQLPASQKLAKMELQKLTAPEAAPQAPAAKAAPSPAFTQVWDPLENQPAAKPPEPPPPVPQSAPPPAGPSAAAAEAEERTRYLVGALESRSRDLADLGTRLLLLEEQVRSSLPPPLTGAAVLARDVKQLIDRRSFAEAERALQDPLVAKDAILQLLLGQVLSSATTDPSRLDGAAAAFRRASELDASWAQPRALLGAVLWRQGKRAEARTEFHASLQIDPACPEALSAAALSTFRPRAPALALSGAAGAVAVALLAVALRPTKDVLPPQPRIESSAAIETASPQPQAPHPRPAPEPQSQHARPAPAAQPAPQAPHPGPAPQPQVPPPSPAPMTLRLPEPEPAPQVPKRPRPKPSRAPASRPAAELESAKGDKALRAFDTTSAQTAFAAALKLDPDLPSAHRGLGMVYVLLGKNAEARSEYARYLELAPDAPDKERISRVLAR